MTKGKKFKIEGIREGWAWVPRQWTKVITDTGIGNPKQATVEKGKKWFTIITETIANFFIDIAKVDTTEMYE